jgi:hypothetical protein
MPRFKQVNDTLLPLTAAEEAARDQEEAIAVNAEAAKPQTDIAGWFDGDPRSQILFRTLEAIAISLRPPLTLEDGTLVMDSPLFREYLRELYEAARV